ncbi:MAG TPA: redoxin domain-containing protein [Patescibacteria group bacterium]|nr:redoxin domain-containing protein [Patescibacteria group bacterium]
MKETLMVATTVNGVIPAGTRVPGFTLPRPGGGEVTLPDRGAKGLTLAIFFKNSCPTCRLIFPFVQRLHEQVEGFGGRVVAISQDGLEGAREFAREFGLTMPMVADGDDWPVSREYDLVSVPTLYLVDGEGTVVRGLAGFQKAGLMQVAADLAASVGAPSPALYHEGESLPDLKPG